VLEETDELAAIFTCDSPWRYFGDFFVFNDNFVDIFLCSTKIKQELGVTKRRGGFDKSWAMSLGKVSWFCKFIM